MSEQQKLTEVYANSLIMVAETIKKNNELGKENVVLKLVKQMNSASKNMIKMLEFDQEIMA
ncbi:MAG: hypothetical protein CBD97_04090 [Pelagibacteraceae bacterium TMED237]|nr:MAG: hypothetical protein CBD97_04090 [Pelagibacteraceae bacterium TMED237]|tara:strand:+ start:9413 stop:9595 length:183 start_codon:yes stop_codon:yes gene_type:complete